MSYSLLLISVIIIINTLIIKNFNFLSKSFNLFDKPNSRKIHKKSTSLMGGIIFFFNFLVIQFVLVFISDTDNFFSLFDMNTLITFNFFLLIVFFMGLFDDLYSLNPYVRLFGISIIVYFFILLDPSIKVDQLLFNYNQYDIRLGKFSIFFTILSILLFINATNMFDGINLQSLLLFSFCFIILYLKLFYNLEILIIIISLFFLMLLNFQGKIFLGNNGVMLISFVISIFFIKTYNQYSLFFADEIFLIMLIPGLDMLRLFIQRLINKKNPFKSDMEHIHHYAISILPTYMVNIFTIFLVVFSYLTGYFTSYIFGIFIGFIFYTLSIIYFKYIQN